LMSDSSEGVNFTVAPVASEFTTSMLRE
jgi:hypothetical protein